MRKITGYHIMMLLPCIANAMEISHSIINPKSILHAAFNGNLPLLKMHILDQKGVSDDKGNTALIYACQEGHADIVQELINVNVPLDTKDETGQTALMYACESGHNEIVKILIGAGASVNVYTKNGKTPLMCAAIAKLQFTQRSNIIDELVKAGAKLSAIDANGNTALDYAKRWGSKQSEELLRSYRIELERRCIVS